MESPHTARFSELCLGLPQWFAPLLFLTFYTPNWCCICLASYHDFPKLEIVAVLLFTILLDFVTYTRDEGLLPAFATLASPATESQTKGTEGPKDLHIAVQTDKTASSCLEATPPSSRWSPSCSLVEAVDGNYPLDMQLRQTQFVQGRVLSGMRWILDVVFFQLLTFVTQQCKDLGIWTQDTQKKVKKSFKGKRWWQRKGSERKGCRQIRKGWRVCILRICTALATILYACHTWLESL